jgi:hypothetical protein
MKSPVADTTGPLNQGKAEKEACHATRTYAVDICRGYDLGRERRRGTIAGFALRTPS